MNIETERIIIELRLIELYLNINEYDKSCEDSYECWILC